MIRSIVSVCAMSVALVVAGCNVVGGKVGQEANNRLAKAKPGLKDGELAVPEGYRDWPVFLSAINKVAGKQIRDIYISPLGHQTEPGAEFADGTVSVMELWNVKTDSDGEPLMDENGTMEKKDLRAVYVMGKSAGAGELVANAALRTGDWVYAAYEADGVTPGGPDTAACRGCHVAEADKDWVFRYDEYFARRE